MEKTKIIILTTALALLTAAAIAGIAYAQTLNAPTYPTQTGTYGQTSASGHSGYGAGSFSCPGLNSYGYSGAGAQNGYVSQPRTGMGGMMGRLGW